VDDPNIWKNPQPHINKNYTSVNRVISANIPGQDRELECSIQHVIDQGSTIDLAGSFIALPLDAKHQPQREQAKPRRRRRRARPYFDSPKTCDDISSEKYVLYGLSTVSH
jgi:hypothetical protein